MIVAEQKPMDDLKRMVKGKKKVLAVGCGTCVAVCFSGGKKETGALASALETAAAVDGETVEVEEKTVQRQCVQEFIEPLAEDLQEYDAVLSLGCGVGVQTLADRFPETRVLPGLDTQFMGQPTEPGIWEERCVGCGNCVLEYTGGLCPITRCPKQLFNGPCGGSENGMCEVDTSLPCVWSKIWENAENLELTDTLLEIQPPQDWSTSRSGGLRRTVVRDDLHQPSAVGKADKRSSVPLPAFEDKPLDPNAIWTRVCAVADIAERSMKKFTVADVPVMIANLGDCWRAFPPECPHMAEPLEDSGFLENGLLTCTKHIWQWNLRTGEMMGTAERPILYYDVKEEDGGIFVSAEIELVYEHEEEEEFSDDDFFNAD